MPLLAAAGTAAGTVATAISAVRAHGWTVHVRFGTGLWFVAALTAAVMLTRTISTTIICLYRDRQETRRKEIDRHGDDAIAEAIAQVIAATQARAENLPRAKAMEEAARVRASAREVFSQLSRP